MCPFPFKNSQQDKEKHPFGGCARLLEQYHTIGQELLVMEQTNGTYGAVAPSSLKKFREGVSFVPVEVLESYLEDLLDLKLSGEHLFIHRENLMLRVVHFAFLGLIGAVAIGLYAASAGASLFLSFALTVCLAFPFAVLWHFSPREGMARRMRFAQIISHEISRRRGSGKSGKEATTPRFSIGEMLRPKSGSTEGVARGMTLH